jgi:hypothetical protein
MKQNFLVEMLNSDIIDARLKSIRGEPGGSFVRLIAMLGSRERKPK